MKIMKKFLFLKIFLFALYSPTIFAITCSTGSGGSSGSYSWAQETTATFSVRQEHSSVLFENKMWVLGGEARQGFANSVDEVWNSEDGVTWTEVTAGSAKKFTRRREHSSVVFDDDTGEGEKIWVIGGRISGTLIKDVWNSTDGKTWNEVRANDAVGGFSARSGHTSVVFRERIWVIGGFDSGNDVLDDVWSSKDGVTWTEATTGSSAKFPARFNHESVVFDDGSSEKIWVIGGLDGSSDVLDDVWSSTDGKTWTEETKDSSEKFTARHSHESVVFDDKIWVFGGSLNDNHNTVNDVWSSEDGKTWNKVRGNGDANGFTDRHSATSVLFKKKVWLIGGYNDKISGHRNDVWSMKKD
jgi:dihydrofolate reductase